MIRIFTVDQCYVEIAKNRYPVSSFQVELAENTLPAISIRIDSHAYAADTSPLPRIVAQTLGVADYIKMYDKFQVYCDKRELANFYCKIIEKDNKGKLITEYIIDIKKWLCTASGFDTVSAGGAVAFGITLSHPAYRIVTATSYLYNVFSYSKSEWDANTNTATNPYDSIKNGMKLYLSWGENIDSEGWDQGRKQILDKYNDVIKTLMDNIVVSDDFTRKWPMEYYGDLRDFIRESTWTYVEQLLMENPWNWLVSKFCPDWFLSVKPDFTDKLKLSIFNPWDEPKYSLPITDVQSIKLPNQDMEPLSGLYTAQNWGNVGMISAFSAKPNAGDVVSDTPKGPAMIEGASYVEPETDGMIQRIQLPMWFDYAISYSGRNKISALIPMQMHSYANGMDRATAPIPELSQESFEYFKKQMNGVVQDLFFVKYKQAMGVTLSARFMTKIKGADGSEVELLPGAVMTLNNRELIRKRRSSQALAKAASDAKDAKDAYLFAKSHSTSSDTEADKALIAQLAELAALTEADANKVSEPPVTHTEELLRFYVTSVAHIVDCNSNQASTEIGGRYVRTTKLRIMKKSKPNAEAKADASASRDAKDAKDAYLFAKSHSTSSDTEADKALIAQLAELAALTEANANKVSEPDPDNGSRSRQVYVYSDNPEQPVYKPENANRSN